MTLLASTKQEELQEVVTSNNRTLHRDQARIPKGVLLVALLALVKLY